MSSLTRRMQRSLDRRLKNPRVGTQMGVTNKNAKDLKARLERERK